MGEVPLKKCISYLESLTTFGAPLSILNVFVQYFVVPCQKTWDTKNFGTHSSK